MAATDNTFSKRILARSKEIGASRKAIMIKAALVIDQVVVTTTPVNTGRARSNWIASVNAPVGAERDAYAPGKDGSTAAANTQAAIDQGRAAIQSFKDGDTSIHISNNLPYIGELNNGSSKQAPANFIEGAIKTAIAAIGGIKLLKD